MTSVPHHDEPDIYEVIAEALIAASKAHMEASAHFEDGLKRIRHCLDLHRQSEEVMERSLAAETEAAGLMAEAAELTRHNSQENIARAIALIAQVAESNRQARAMSAGAYALTRQASDEMLRGLAVWSEGTKSLQVGVERAATLLQQARRQPTNGDAPDTLAA